MLPRIDLPFVIYTDASDFRIGAVLVHIIDGKERAITWISRRLHAAEVNYTATEKECLAVIWAIEKLKIYLVNEFIIKTDHSALKWLLGLKETSGRLARWVMSIQGLPYIIEHIRGEENAFADVLSRGLAKSRIDRNLNTISTIMEPTENKEELIIRTHHELGHAGSDSVYIFMKQRWTWPKMLEDIKKYVEHCDTCRKFKSGMKKLEIQKVPLGQPFSCIGIDIVGPLPKTENGNCFIIIATDHLTRWAEASALKAKTAKNVAKFIMEKRIWQLGAPEMILSDQGREFKNEIVNQLCKMLSIVLHICLSPSN